jgi:antitoxin component of RelBE/YafQ-DinJ toxin-antitoxin module
MGMTEKGMTGMMTTQMTPHESPAMSTIHFRIDDDVKRLAMRAAERQKKTLTEVMRQRAEELAAEERQYQEGKHDAWLEEQITAAFSRYDAGESEFISNDEMNARMEELKAQAARGTL